MKTKSTKFSRKFFVLIALAIITSPLMFNPFNASAQQRQARGERNERTLPVRDLDQEPPLIKPLATDDPRAKLGEEWLAAPPMHFPFDAIPGAANTDPLGAAEAAFDPRSGQESLALEPGTTGGKSNLFNFRTAENFWPGSLGPNAEVDSRDVRVNPAEDNGQAQVPGQGLNSVIGTDDRTRISPTTSFPWRAMTKLRMTFPNNLQYTCSGAMVAAKYVLTAGHCVYSRNDGGWARSIEVIPGLDGTYKPYGSAYAVYMRSYQGWTRDNDSNYDFALITLNRSIGSSTGWFGYASYSTVNGLTANLGGYPGDRDGGQRLYYHYGPIIGSTTNRVSYTIDTFGGQSGSGVYRINNGQRYIFAVHTNGGTSANSGTRITSQRFSDLSSWIASGN